MYIFEYQTGSNMFHIKIRYLDVSPKHVRFFGRSGCQEGPAFRCPESVALAADFEREGAEVFWVEAMRGVGLEGFLGVGG